jgi:small subunit ribosomal protein S30e
VPTHGSLSKAGKVRQQTPKLEKSTLKKKKGPRMANRKKFVQRFKRTKIMVKERGRHR